MFPPKNGCDTWCMQIAWPNLRHTIILFGFVEQQKKILFSFLCFVAVCCPYKYILFVYLFMLIYCVCVSSYTIFISYSTLHYDDAIYTFHIYSSYFFTSFFKYFYTPDYITSKKNIQNDHIFNASVDHYIITTTKCYFFRFSFEPNEKVFVYM